MERIIHAAILRSDRVIIFDRDHARCLIRANRCLCEGDVDSKQGFLTSKLRFVDRYHAAAIAFQAKQIDKWQLGQGIVSEEFWCPKSGGKHDYDETAGYVLRTKS